MFVKIKITFPEITQNMGNNDIVFRNCHCMRVFSISNFPFALQNVFYQSQQDLLLHVIATNAATAYLRIYIVDMSAQIVSAVLL